MNGDTEETRRDGLLAYRLACPPLTQYVVGSRPSWFIPNTKIKLVKTPPCLAGRRWGRDARLSKRLHGNIVCGTVYGDMPFKDLLR